MNTLIDALVMYLKHQDVMHKQIASWDTTDKSAIATTKTNEKWLAAAEPQQGDFEKVFLAAHAHNAKQCLQLVEGTLSDARVRIILFDKKGLRVGHIIPSHIKTDVQQYVSAILKNV